MAHIIISTNGAPVGKHPTFLWRKDNCYILKLHRIDVFELNGVMKSDPIYLPTFQVIKTGGEIDIITPTHVISLTKWRPFINAFRHDSI